MLHMLRVVLSPLLVLIVVGGIIGQTITSNHELTDGSSVSTNDMSSGVMDLEPPGEENDAEPELDGTISSNTSGIKRIADIKFWFEDTDGNKLKDGNGNCPISALATVGGSGAPTNSATLVSNSNGVSTFNLSDDVNRGAFVGYAAQVDYFNEDANYKIKMAFSQEDASEKHFLIVGMSELTEDDPHDILDGIAPTLRTGVLMTVKNTSSTQTLESVKVTVVSNQSTLELLGGTVRDEDDALVPGAQVNIAQDSKTATVSGILLENPDLINIWLDLNEAYDEATTFKIHGGY